MSESPLDLRSRARGVLLGLAYGDALGCPIESWQPQTIADVYGLYDSLPRNYPLERIRQVDARLLRRLRPLGLHSDDTQQALALTWCTLAGFEVAEFARWLVEGMQAHAWRGFGGNFARAVRRLAKGIAPRLAGSPSAGIGAAMRIAPVGMVLRDDLAELRRVVFEASCATHADLRAIAVAYAIAWASAAFARGDSIERVRAGLGGAVIEAEDAWLVERSDWTFEPARGVGATLERLLREEEAAPAELRARLCAAALGEIPPQPRPPHPNQGLALLGGVHAIVVALSEPAGRDPSAALSEIMQLGLDTDTVGAMAGGLLGARLGAAWVPVERLHDRERLVWAAEAIAEGRVGETREDFLALEAALTRVERAFSAQEAGVAG